jgi:hypothetical protein
VKCAEAQMVLAARGKKHRAFDDEPVQGRRGGGKRVSESAHSIRTRSGTHYTPAGSATTATPRQSADRYPNETQEVSLNGDDNSERISTYEAVHVLVSPLTIADTTHRWPQSTFYLTLHLA